MTDRLAFENVVLGNGITVYSKRWDVSFVTVRLYVPVGHKHNTGFVLPGSAHCLEHLALHRSQSFKEPDAFGGYVAQKGGDFNAGTSLSLTEFSLDIPSCLFSSIFPLFVEHICNPYIRAEHIIHEAGIISNERRRVSKWHPGNSELEQHCKLQWKYDRSVDTRQIFGNDEDLAEMSPEGLLRLHEAYLDPRVYLIVGGTYDLDVICKALEGITTRPHTLATRYDPTRWENRTYHEVSCVESDRHIYHLGGIIENDDPVVFAGINLLGNLLVNPTQGVLYHWLRKELGWIYDLGFDISRAIPPELCDWELWLPFSEPEQVQITREKLHDKILRAIGDQVLISQECDRTILQQVYWYQTISSVVREAATMLHTFGKIITEEESIDILQQCANNTFLQEIYETHWSPKVSGEFLALPKTS